MRAAGALGIAANRSPSATRVPRRIRAVTSVRPYSERAGDRATGPPKDFACLGSRRSVVVRGSQAGPAAARPGAGEASAADADSSHNVANRALLPAFKEIRAIEDAVVRM